MILYRKNNRPIKAKDGEKLTSEERKARAKQEGYEMAQDNEWVQRYNAQQKQAEATKHRQENPFLNMMDQNKELNDSLPFGMNILANTVTAPLRLGANLYADTQGDYYSTPENGYWKTGLGDDLASTAALGFIAASPGLNSLVGNVVDEATLGVRHIPSMMRGAVNAAKSFSKLGKRTPSAAKVVYAKSTSPLLEGTMPGYEAPPTKPITMKTPPIKMKAPTTMTAGQIADKEAEDRAIRNVINFKGWKGRLNKNISMRELNQVVSPFRTDEHANTIKAALAEYRKRTLDPRNYKRVVEQLGKTKADQRVALVKRTIGEDGTLLKPELLDIVPVKPTALNELADEGLLGKAYTDQRSALVLVRPDKDIAESLYHELSHIFDAVGKAIPESAVRDKDKYIEAWDAVSKHLRKYMTKRSYTPEQVDSYEKAISKNYDYMTRKSEISARLGTDLRTEMYNAGIIKDINDDLPVDETLKFIAKNDALHKYINYYVRPDNYKGFIEYINKKLPYAFAPIMLNQFSKGEAEDKE